MFSIYCSPTNAFSHCTNYTFLCHCNGKCVPLATATESSSTPGVVAFSLSSNPGSIGSITTLSTTGTIVVATDKSLNYEATQLYVFVIL